MGFVVKASWILNNDLIILMNRKPISRHFSWVLVAPHPGSEGERERGREGERERGRESGSERESHRESRSVCS